MSYELIINKISINKLIKSLYSIVSASNYLLIALLIFISISIDFAKPHGLSNIKHKWVGTWSTALQLVETGNNPPSPGLSNNTIRQIVRVSIGGDSLRIRFSNEFSTNPVTMNSVHVAVSKGSGTIDPSTDKEIYFNGKPDITMQAGAAVTSDPFQFALQPRTDVAITIYFGSTSTDVTGHPGSRTTSYILAGNAVAQTNFTGAVTTDHWYVINTIDVLAPESAAAIVVIGNSITDGRGSGTNKQNRWPDELARLLQEKCDTQQVAVLNQGIGGNCVLRACLGPSALDRFKRDVINQNGVNWLIIFEGINDIGQAWGTGVANELIAAFQKMIDSAHVKGILVYGATLLPFGGSSYYSADHETARQAVNKWIRNSGHFDAVIDLDKTLRDPRDTLKLLSSADSGDHLHPSETGHRMIAEAVDLNLFLEGISTDVSDNHRNTPSTFSLLQNYPNPFNPNTKIKFSLPQKSQTRLIVYDTLGREVHALINKELEAGYHEVDFDASKFQSGVYFYRIQSGTCSQTKKMILIK